ncbi:MAG: PAS domain S-box protein [Candidatus Latescibacteria bacterium]|nr:PAS domain S-box protein [Candidatus Latescibacterota bacterium]
MTTKTKNKELLQKIESLQNRIIELEKDSQILSESEDKYHRIFDSALDAIFILDKTQIADCNDKTSTMFGYNKSELVGKHIFELSPTLQPSGEESRKLAMELVLKVMNGANQFFEWLHIRANSTLFYAEVSLCLLPISSGYRLFAIVRDITERKKIEAELFSSEQKLNAIVNNTPDIIYQLDPEGVITYINNAVVNYGYNPESLIGTSIFNYIDKQYHNEVRQHLSERRTGEQSTKNIEVKIFSADRDELYFETKNVPAPTFLLVAEGLYSINSTKEIKWQGTQGIARDITQKKQAEEALRESEERFRSLVQGLEDMIFVLDSNSIFTYESPSVHRILGYHSGYYLGKSPFPMVHPEDRVFCEQRFNEVLQNKSRAIPTKFRVKRADGEWIYVEALAQNLLDNHAVRGVVLIARDISEREKTEKNLRESEERFRSMIQGSSDMIFVLDKHSILIYESPSVERILGYPGGYFIGQSPFNLIHTEDRDRIVHDLDEVIQSVNPGIPSEFRIKRADGEWIFLEALGQNMLNNSAVCGIVIIARNITERKKIENALRESEERFRNMADNSPVMIGVSDAEGNAVFLNRTYIEFRGSTFGKERDGGWIESLHPDDRERILRLHIDVINNKKSDSFEYRQKNHSGEYRWLLHAISPYFDSQGICLGFISSSYDITERKTAEDALRESENRLHQLVDNIREIVWLRDRETGEILYVNRSFESITGYSNELLLKNGSEFITKIHPEDAEQFIRASRELYKNNKPIHQDYRLKRADGTEIWIRSHAYPIQDNSGKTVRFSGVAEDITERKRLEAQFIQAQKMESIGRLAGGVAHDFNNLLTIINLSVEMASSSGLSEETINELIADIRNAGERGASLTRQLLAFSRKQIIEPIELNINDVIIQMDKLFRRLIGEDIELVTILDESIHTIKIDPGQIEQVLTNLIVNTRDAMPAGGKIIIETSEVLFDDDFVKFHPDVSSGEFVTISVSDTGTGMDEHVKANLFEPFFTTKDKGKGTGLGLSTCYGIMKQNNGSIRVYSEPGKGSTFIVNIPFYGEGAIDRYSIQERDDIHGGSETILIVEDDETIRKLTEQILDSSGYNIITAANGEEALVIAEKYKNIIHLVLTDVVMPLMSGRELATQLLASRQNIKIIYMSGYTDNTIVHHGLLDSGILFIQKPFSPSTLLRKIRQVLDS